MRVVVFGSGGMAKDVIGYLERENRSALLGGYVHDLPWNISYVVSTESFNNPAFDYEVRDRHEGKLPCILAVADPVMKRTIVAVHPNADWMTFVHSSAHVSPHAKIGRGCVIAPSAMVLGDAIVGDFCTFNVRSSIHHDSKLGDYSTLSPNAVICGHCEIGDDCFMGVGASVVPCVRLADHTSISAGAIVRESFNESCTIYGDKRGEYRVLPQR